MPLAPTKYQQPIPGPLLLGIGAGIEPGNYAKQLCTLAAYINDIQHAEVGNYGYNVTAPQDTVQAVPADLYQSVFNAYGTALNAMITRRTLSTTPWSTLTTLSATNWASFYNQLATLAMTISDAVTVAAL
jgi:hypothetical protein